MSESQCRLWVFSVPFPKLGSHNCCSSHVFPGTSLEDSILENLTSHGKSSQMITGDPPMEQIWDLGHLAIRCTGWKAQATLRMYTFSSLKSHLSAWTNGHRSPDTGGKPPIQRTGQKYEVRKNIRQSAVLAKSPKTPVLASFISDSCVASAGAGICGLCVRLLAPKRLHHPGQLTHSPPITDHSFWHLIDQTLGLLHKNIFFSNKMTNPGPGIPPTYV